jgi:hypothetical protein
VTLQSGADLALGDTSVFSNQVSLVSLNGGISKAAGTLQGETIAFDSNGAVNLAEGATNFSRVAGTAAGNILLKDPDSIEVSSLPVLRASGVSENLDGISTPGNIGITTVGNITSTERISANELNAKSDGAQTLLTKVDRLISDAASLTVEERDSIDLIDIDASSISVRAGGRINARDLSGARISLESTGGGIEIGSAVATRSLRLTSTGAITQTGPLSTSDLVLASGSFINLSNARNTLKTLGNVIRGGEFRLTDSEGGLTLDGKIAGNSNSSVRLVTRGGLSLLRGAEIEVSGAGNQLVLVANDDGARGEFTSKAGSSALKTGPGTDTFIFSTSIKGNILTIGLPREVRVPCGTSQTFNQ